tara:strand:+ start:49 stop:480 length:432 start_codon:yes stop_codon:yes gene_type:complete
MLKLNYMYKISMIVILLTVFGLNNLFASCGDDLKGSWKYQTLGGQKSNVNYTWKNFSDKSIVITRVGLVTADDKWVKEIKKDIGIEPFGVRTYSFYVGDKNLDVVTHGSWNCRYGSVAKKKSTPFKPKQKSGAQKWLDKIRGN